ncbi:hypothetical protein LCGC14_2167350, partial [marine sediment metagenome]
NMDIKFLPDITDTTPAPSWRLQFTDQYLENTVTAIGPEKLGLLKSKIAINGVDLPIEIYGRDSNRNYSGDVAVFYDGRDDTEVNYTSDNYISSEIEEQIVSSILSLNNSISFSVNQQNSLELWLESHSSNNSFDTLVIIDVLPWKVFVENDGSVLENFLDAGNMILNIGSMMQVKVSNTSTIISNTMTNLENLLDCVTCSITELTVPSSISPTPSTNLISHTLYNNDLSTSRAIYTPFNKLLDLTTLDQQSSLDDIVLYDIDSTDSIFGYIGLFQGIPDSQKYYAGIIRDLLLFIYNSYDFSTNISFDSGYATIGDEKINIGELGQLPVLALPFDYLDPSLEIQSRDFSIFENHISLINNSILVDGYFGSGLEISDTEYVTVSDSDSLDVKQFTLDFDINPTIPDTSSYRNLIEKDESFLIRQHGDDIEAKVYVNGSWSTIISWSDILQPDMWHHIRFTYDGQYMYLMVNGQNIIGERIQAVVTPTNLTSSTSVVRIGGIATGTPMTGNAIIDNIVLLPYSSRFSTTTPAAFSFDAIGSIQDVSYNANSTKATLYSPFGTRTIKEVTSKSLMDIDNNGSYDEYLPYGDMGRIYNNSLYLSFNGNRNTLSVVENKFFRNQTYETETGSTQFKYWEVNTDTNKL